MYWLPQINVLEYLPPDDGKLFSQVLGPFWGVPLGLLFQVLSGRVPLDSGPRCFWGVPLASGPGSFNGVPLTSGPRSFLGGYSWPLVLSGEYPWSQVLWDSTPGSWSLVLSREYPWPLVPGTGRVPLASGLFLEGTLASDPRSFLEGTLGLCSQVLSGGTPGIWSQVLSGRYLWSQVLSGGYTWSQGRAFDAESKSV